MKASARLHTVALLVALILSPFAPGVRAFPPAYAVTDLGTLGGSSSTANSINNPGAIVGTAFNAAGQQHGFLWQDGQMIDLGTFGGLQSFANIINDHGQIGGAADHPDGARTGFLWSQGTLFDLGALPGSTFSTVFGLNNRGQLLGGSTLAGASFFHAVFFTPDGLVDLGTLGGVSSFGVRVSDIGWATGRADLATGFSRAFLYRGGALEDLGVLPGDARSFGRSVNNRGDVVAQSCTATVSSCRPFLWRDGQITDLGTLGGAIADATEINELSQVVGFSRTPTSGAATRAFLWQEGEMVDLNTLLPEGSGWVLLRANSINNRGLIVGQGTIGGAPHAFLLTPT